MIEPVHDLGPFDVLEQQVWHVIQTGEVVVADLLVPFEVAARIPDGAIVSWPEIGPRLRVTSRHPHGDATLLVVEPMPTLH